MTEFRWTTLSIKHMIYLYRERPVLYDAAHPKYTNRKSRMQALREIATELNATAQIVRKRLLSLRSQYLKELRKKKMSKTVYKSRLWCFHLLKFLEPHCLKRRSTDDLQLSSGQAKRTDLEMDTHKTIRFIEVVFNNECLWNVTAKAYRNEMLRNEIWASIAEEFQMSGEAAYAYFEKLRERYYFEMEKPQESQWPLLRCLQFLDESFKDENVSSSKTCASEDTEQSSIQEEESSAAPDLNIDSVCSLPKSNEATATDAMAQAITENTLKLVTALNTAPASQHEDVVTFVRGTFNALPKDKAKEFERDIMYLCMKYRYKK